MCASYGCMLFPTTPPPCSSLAARPTSVGLYLHSAASYPYMPAFMVSCTPTGAYNWQGPLSRALPVPLGP